MPVASQQTVFTVLCGSQIYGLGADVIVAGLEGAPHVIGHLLWRVQR